MGESVIEVSDLAVEYGKGRNKVRALDGISFQVSRGECVGFVGANGAGKSTTIKTLLGFIFPASGKVSLFGQPCGTAASRARVGYLPEVALYYPFMKARELLQLYGGLHGLSRGELIARIPAVLERVGLAGKGETLLRNFSKGMQQRLGIAQAIIADPEMLIFDEMSSGLDPLGRHDLRNVLIDLKQRGRTIFFSSHELTEVENLCDRVIIIHKGRIVTQTSVSELMRPLSEFHVTFTFPEGYAAPTSVAGHMPERDGNLLRISTNDASEFSRVVGELAQSAAAIRETSSRNRSLEEYYLDLIGGGGARNQ